MVSKVWSFNGGFNGEEEEEKSNVGVRRRASEFFLLSEEREGGFYFKRIFSFLFPKSYATCLLLSGAKRGPLFS